MWSWKDILTPRTPTPDAILDFGLTIFQEGVWEGSKTDAQGIPMWTRLSGAHNLDQIFKQTSRGLIADLKQTSSGLQDAFQQASMRFQALCKTSSGHQASQIISFYTTGQHVKKIQKEYILKGQVSWIWTPVMMTPCEWGPSLQRKWNFVETSA